MHQTLLMKFALYLYFFTVLPAFTLADAGPNIRRPKAPCYAVFTGIDKLSNFEFYKTSEYEEIRNGDRIFDSSYTLKNNDTVKLFYKEGSRHWQVPAKILIENKSTHQFVDSLILSAEGDNLTINFTGAENDKVKYTIEKTKAEYPYQLYLGEDVKDGSLAKRNKYILISLSVIGFLLLVFMFLKRRKNNEILISESDKN